MAVRSYLNKNGETQFLVSVCVRSKTKKNLRIQREWRGFKTLVEAKRKETSLLRETERELLNKETQGATWGALVEAWEEHLIESESSQVDRLTLSDYSAILRRYTESWWKRPVSQITKLDVLEAINQMKALGKSRGFQRRLKGLIHRIFTFGMDSGLTQVERSPAYGISIKKIEEKKPEILTLDQIKRLLSNAKQLNHSWYSIWAFALLTGMRSGELYALLWSDIDLENRIISVTKSYNGRLKIIKSTKAGYWRQVPISSELYSLLLELKQETKSSSYVLPRKAEWKSGDQAYILRKFCIGIGLPSIKFHTLRACFATQLIRSKVAPAVVMKICGWKDLETMQRYIRLSGIETQGATEGLEVLPEKEATEKVVCLFSR